MSDGVHQALIRSNEVAAFPVVPGPGPVGIGCSQQLVPAPVLADDYGCADFDSGNLPEMNPGDQNWLALVPTPPAVLTTTTDRSSSPTYSLQTTASNAMKV